MVNGCHIGTNPQKKKRQKNTPPLRINPNRFKPASNPQLNYKNSHKINQPNSTKKIQLLNYKKKKKRKEKPLSVVRPTHERIQALVRGKYRD